MNQTWPRTTFSSRQPRTAALFAAKPVTAPAMPAGTRGHCFGSVSVLPPQTVPREILQRDERVQRDDDDPPASADSPDAGVPASGAALTGMDPAGGAIPMGGGNGGSTTVQPPTMAANVIHGATLADVSNALGAEAGAVDFAISVSQTQGDPITSATVTVSQVMTLPQWAERGTQCAAAQAAWDSFLSALRNHENGHVTIDNQRLGSIHRRFLGIGVSDVQSRTDTVTAEVQAVQDAYDARTQHGTTQTPPTILDTSVVCPAPAAPGAGGTP